MSQMETRKAVDIMITELREFLSLSDLPAGATEEARNELVRAHVRGLNQELYQIHASEMFPGKEITDEVVEEIMSTVLARPEFNIGRKAAV